MHGVTADRTDLFGIRIAGRGRGDQSTVELRVRWFNAGGGGDLYLEWWIPTGAGYEPIPVANFTPA